MAVVSDSMFNSCSTTTFVSSNAYYGYVPPCSTRVAQNRLLDFTGSGCSLTNQMETDEDCSPQVNNFTFAEQNHRFLEQYEQPSGQTNALRSRNRKRGNAESASSMSISQQKKFREEAVITTTFSMVQEAQRTMDWPRCIMNQHNYC